MILKYAGITMDTEKKMITFPKKMGVFDLNMAILQLRRNNTHARTYCFPLKPLTKTIGYAAQDWRLQRGPRGIPGRVIYDLDEKRRIDKDALKEFLAHEDAEVARRKQHEKENE